MFEEFRSLGVSAAFSRWSLDYSGGVITANTLSSTLELVHFACKELLNSQTPKLQRASGACES